MEISNPDQHNLSAQLANITSTGRLSVPPLLEAAGEPLLDETTYE
jgi:hypothetical protein